MKSILVTAGLLVATAVPFAPLADAQQADSRMSFFLTSNGPGKGADLGGVEGADAHCRKLAEAVGVSGKTWHAYLSTSAADGKPALNARDRIGSGPWFNVKDVEVAKSVADLHSANNNLTKQTVLNEKGEVVNGRGDTPNRHDVLTGSRADGTAFPPDGDHTCQNWTSSGAGSAQIGHFDRTGGGDDGTSWNSAHPTRGCSQEDLKGTGGDGLFYCFAVN